MKTFSIERWIKLLGRGRKNRLEKLNDEKAGHLEEVRDQWEKIETKHKTSAL